MGGDKVWQEFKNIGSDGQKAFQRITQVIRPANDNLKVLDNTAKAFNNTLKQTASLARAYLGLRGLTSAFKGIVQTNKEFELLSGSLKTVTGSSKAAKEAFTLIEDFATATPYQLDEIVDSFIRLKAMGLEPSMEALTSYGNTASTFGKNITDFTDAVSSAVMLNFKSLRTFGIQTQIEGDKVRFTFQGITSTVGKSAQEIEAYLKSIGLINPEHKAEREKHQMDALIQLKMVAYVAMLSENAKCILMRQYKQISIQVGEIINLIMAWKKVMINNGKQKSFESERIKRGKVDNAYCASWSASSNENENLVAAHKLCRLSKQHKQGTIMFEIELGRNVTNFVKQLQNKTYRLSPYRSFTIYDPKKRLIEALPYKDRVVLMCFCQHSVAPQLERHLIYDNAASRKEKGTHFAVERLHSFMRKLYIKNKSDLFFEMRHQEIFSKHQS